MLNPLKIIERLKKETNNSVFLFIREKSIKGKKIYVLDCDLEEYIKTKFEG